MNEIFKKLFHTKAGYWKKENNNISLHLERDYENNSNLLYCFISNQTILYIGKTTRTLKNRMYGYLNPNPSQRTNARVNKNIQEFEGENIEIYIFIDNFNLEHEGFKINLAAGIEDSLIQFFKPEWNIVGNNQI